MVPVRQTLLLLFQLKGSGDVEPEMYISIEKVAGSLCKEGPLCKPPCICKDQLKHVAPGLNVNSKANWVVVRIPRWHTEAVVILRSKRYAPGDLNPASDSKQCLIIFFYGYIHCVLPRNLVRGGRYLPPGGPACAR